MLTVRNFRNDNVPYLRLQSATVAFIFILFGTIGLANATLDDEAAQPAKMPDIYIDQTIVSVAGNTRRELYADLLRVCQEEGITSKALTKEERSRLGTIRLQRWIDAERTAYRLESWDYELGDPRKTPKCHFSLVSRGRHVLIDQHGLRGFNLNDNSVIDSRPLNNSDAALLLRRPANSNTNPGSSKRFVAGQPCVQSTLPGSAKSITCTWSGGADWGFEPQSNGIESVMTANPYALFKNIVLYQEPAGNNMDRIRTVVFNLRDPLDGSAMRPAFATALPADRPRY